MYNFLILIIKKSYLNFSTEFKTFSYSPNHIHSFFKNIPFIKWLIEERGMKKYLNFRKNFNKNNKIKEDQAIIELVRKYGIRKWTIVSQKMEELFMMKGRSGKQCRERFYLFFWKKFKIKII